MGCRSPSLPLPLRSAHLSRRLRPPPFNAAHQRARGAPPVGLQITSKTSSARSEAQADSGRIAPFTQAPDSDCRRLIWPSPPPGPPFWGGQKHVAISLKPRRLRRLFLTGTDASDTGPGAVCHQRHGGVPFDHKGQHSGGAGWPTSRSLPLLGKLDHSGRARSRLELAARARRGRELREMVSIAGAERPSR